MINPWKKYSSVNPQREAGCRQISNNLFSALVKVNLTGAEFKICLAIMDQTWGFNKPFDIISCSRFMGLTGLSERAVKKVIKGLKKKRIIYYEPSKRGVNCGSPLNEYMFNKHYDTWFLQGCTPVYGCTNMSNKGAQTGKIGVHAGSPPTIKEKFKEIIKERKESNKEKFLTSPLFQSFWDAYPSRNGKKLEKAETQERFLKLSPLDQELIVKAAGNYARSGMVQDGIGIKDPKRFIRDGKGNEPWRDWIDPEQSGSDEWGEKWNEPNSNA
jgi:phage replication O-like protein O